MGREKRGGRRREMGAALHQARVPGGEDRGEALRQMGEDTEARNGVYVSAKAVGRSFCEEEWRCVHRSSVAAN